MRGKKEGLNYVYWPSVVRRVQKPAETGKHGDEAVRRDLQGHHRAHRNPESASYFPSDPSLNCVCAEQRVGTRETRSWSEKVAG